MKKKKKKDMRETKVKDEDATSNKMTVICACELVPVVAVFLLRGTQIYVGFVAVTPLSCHGSLLAAGALMALNCPTRAHRE